MKKEKILVIQKKQVGDVLTTSVVLEALKEKYADSEIHYLIYPNSLAIVQNNPFVDKIMIMDENSQKSTLGFIKFLFKIRKEKYTTVIDAYGKPNSVLIGWFSGAKTTITFDKSYSRLLYSHALKRNETSFSEATKAIEHRMLLLEPLGIPFKAIKPKIFITQEEKKEASIRLENAGINVQKPIVMVSAIGSNESKTYPLASMAKVLDTVADGNDIQFLFNYIPFQKDVAYKLYQLCNDSTKAKIHFDFYEESLRNFIAVTSLCKALIGNEGGATNIAKALNIPTFTIFSPLILKNDWNIFEDGKQNISVHISDYETAQNREEIKEYLQLADYKKLYEMFVLDLFKDKLLHFTTINLSTDENRI